MELSEVLTSSALSLNQYFKMISLTKCTFGTKALNFEENRHIFHSLNRHNLDSLAALHTHSFIFSEQYGSHRDGRPSWDDCAASRLQ
jgi:hypothetical protein